MGTSTRAGGFGPPGAGATGQGTGAGASNLQGSLIAAAFANGEAPNAIRTDGTGSRFGVPGGKCDSCSGGKLFQALYLAATVGQIFAGAVIGAVVNKLVKAAKVANEIPETLARVIPGEVTPATLGRPQAADVFVTAADDIAGLSAAQIPERLGIDSSSTFTIFEFVTPTHGLASPIARTNVGFVGGGVTSGGAREFVLRNGPIPAGATRRVVGP
jgi:hypothetical protein